MNYSSQVKFRVNNKGGDGAGGFDVKMCANEDDGFDNIY